MYMILPQRWKKKNKRKLKWRQQKEKKILHNSSIPPGLALKEVTLSKSVEGTWLKSPLPLPLLKEKLTQISLKTSLFFIYFLARLFFINMHLIPVNKAWPMNSKPLLYTLIMKLVLARHLLCHLTRSLLFQANNTLSIFTFTNFHTWHGFYGCLQQ